MLFAPSPQVTLQAEGLYYANASTYTFGTVTVGSSSPDVVFTIQNNGAEDVTLAGAPMAAVAGDDAADFTATDTGVTTLTPGTSTTFTVSFSPGSAGPRDGVIKIMSEDRNSTIYTVNLTGIGSATPVPGIYVPVGTSYYAPGSSFSFGNTTQGVTSGAVTFTIENAGAADLSLGGVTISGGNASDFTVTGPAVASIPAGGSATFTITFTPSSTGSFNAVITIASNDPDVAAFTINLVGTGVAAVNPDINLLVSATGYPSGSAFDYGTVNVGTPSAVTFTIENTGSAGLNLTNVLTTGGNSGDFVVTGPGVAVIPVLGSATFDVTFTPGAVGSRSTTLMIESDDPDENPYSITLGGTGVVIPATATISGEPVGANNVTLLNVDVAGSDIQYYQYKFGATGATDCSDPAGYGVSIAESVNITDDISGLADGSITLCVIGQDSFSTWQLYTAATTAIWTKDTAAPNMAITAPAAGAAVSGTAVISFTDTELTAPQVSVDNLNWHNATSGVTMLSDMAEFAGLGQGGFTLYLRDTDAAGNTGGASIGLTKDTQAPNVAITAPAGGSTVTGNAIISFTDDDPNTPQVSVDNTNWHNATSGVTMVSAISQFAGLPDGGFTLYLRDTDAAGNTGSASIGLVKDATAPAVTITGPANGAMVTGSAIISFTDSDPNSPEVSIDNINWYAATSGVTMLSAISQFAPLPQGGFTLYLRDTDAVGNTGSASIGLIKDTTAPVLAITAPPNGTMVNGSAVITFTDNELTAPQVSVDNTNWFAATSGITTLSAIPQFVAMADIVFTLYLRDTDPAGNTGTASIGLTKDTTAPNVAITAPAAGASVNGTAIISFTNDGSAPEVSVDNTNWFAATSGSTTLSSISQFTVLGEGGFTLYLRDTDAAGNVGNTSIGLIKDTVGPSVSITAPSAGASVNGTAVVSFTNDGPAPQVSVDNVNWFAATSGVTTFSDISQFPALGQGGFTLYLRDTDAAGNTGSTSIGLIKDTIAPNVAITAPAAGASVNGSAVVSFTNDGPAPQVSVDNTNWLAATSGVTTLSAISQFAGLGQGGFTLYLRDTDAAGNIGNASIGLIKDTVLPTLTMSPVPGIITYANQNAYTVSGACSEDTRPVTVTVTDDEAATVSDSPTCSSGSYTTSLNVSGLSDGVGNLAITHTDAAGNTRQIGINPLGKDTTYPIMSVRINNYSQPTGSIYNFGTVENWTTKAVTVDIFNTGTGSLSLPVSPVAFSGANMSEFTTADLESGMISINPGDMATFILNFTPTDVNLRQAVMSISSSDPNTPVYDITLNGNGSASNTADINVKVNGASLDPGGGFDFGTVTTGNTRTARVDVYNYGSANLTLTNEAPIWLTGVNPSEFLINGAIKGPITIQPGCSFSFMTSFAPTQSIASSAQLIIASDDPDTGSFVVTLLGTGTATTTQDIGLKINNLEVANTSTFDFGQVLTTTGSKTVTVEIANKGTADLTLSSAGAPVNLSGTNFPDWDNMTGQPAAGTVIMSGTSVTFTMDFIPPVDGLRIAQLRVFSDDPDTGTYVINLKGTGNPVSVPDIGIELAGNEYAPMSTFNFGAELVDIPISVSSDILNSGTADLNISGVTVVSISGPDFADFVVTGSGAWPAPELVPTGSSLVAYSGTAFNVDFTPSAAGVRRAQMTVVSDDPDTGTYVVNLQGVGVMPRVMVCGGGTSDSAVYDPVMGTFAAGNSTGSQSVNAGGHSFKMQNDAAGRHVLIYGGNSYWAIFNPAGRTFTTQSTFTNNVNEGGNSFPVTAGNNIDSNIILCANGTNTKLFTPPFTINGYDSLSGIGLGSHTFPIPSGGGQIMIIHGGFSTTLSVFDPAGNAGNGSFMTIGNTLTSGAQNGAHSIMIDAPDSPNNGSVLVILGGGSNGVNLYTTGSFNNFGGKTLSGSAGQGASSVPILTGLHRGKRLIIHAGTSPGTPATTLFNPLVDDATTFTPGPNLYNNYNASYGSFSFVVEHGPNAGLIVVVHGGSSFRTSVCDPRFEPLQFNAGPDLPYSGYQYTAGDGAHSFPLK